MRRVHVVYLAAAAAGVGLAVGAMAGDPVQWNFDEASSGQDVFWTSPTSVDPNSQRYLGEYELTGIWVTVEIFGSPVEVDVTDMVDPEDRTGSSIGPGPAPIVILDETVRFPDEPEPVAIQADFYIGLDGDGFGQFSGTNIILGEYDTGFGIVPILAVRIAGTVWITPDPSDIDGDGDVDVDDLLTIIGAWGTPDGDVNGDGTTDVNDLLQVIGDWT